jgi:hypothetical protein
MATGKFSESEFKIKELQNENMRNTPQEASREDQCFQPYVEFRYPGNPNIYCTY